MPERLSQGVASVGGLAIVGGTVTGAANAASLDKLAGKITTESVTTAAAATYTETLTNALVAATDIVVASVTTSGTGTPVIAKITPAAGSIVFVVQNIHSATAFNAALVISYVVVKQS
jgi:hypothetical protein